LKVLINFADFISHKYIVSSSDDKTIKLWDIKSAKLIKTFKGHTDNIKAVSITPDGKNIISGSDDYTIKLWDINL
jgi:WD40 repeat protein